MSESGRVEKRGLNQVTHVGRRENFPTWQSPPYITQPRASSLLSLSLSSFHNFLLVLIMSITQTVPSKVKSPTLSVASPASPPSPPPENSPPTPPAEDLVLEAQDGPTRESRTPRAGQPVFEQLPSIRVTRWHRTVITTLLILANLVQVSTDAFSSGPSDPVKAARNAQIKLGR